MSDPVAADPNRIVELVFIISEIILIALFLTMTKYGEGVHPGFDGD